MIRRPPVMARPAFKLSKGRWLLLRCNWYVWRRFGLAPFQNGFSRHYEFETDTECLAFRVGPFIAAVTGCRVKGVKCSGNEDHGPYCAVEGNNDHFERWKKNRALEERAYHERKWWQNRVKVTTSK